MFFINNFVNPQNRENSSKASRLRLDFEILKFTLKIFCKLFKNGRILKGNIVHKIVKHRLTIGLADFGIISPRNIYSIRSE